MFRIERGFRFRKPLKVTIDNSIEIRNVSVKDKNYKVIAIISAPNSEHKSITLEFVSSDGIVDVCKVKELLEKREFTAGACSRYYKPKDETNPRLRLLNAGKEYDNPAYLVTLKQKYCNSACECDSDENNLIAYDVVVSKNKNKDKSIQTFIEIGGIE